VAILDWLKGRFGRLALEPLTGAPSVRRQKSYSGQSGYVYQYFYEGQRGRAESVEYVFSVTAGRANYFPASVLVSAAGVREWEARHGRELRSNERYGIAKMALFQAFDERPNPTAMREPVLVDALGVAAMLASLDID